jgi:hypothetical protein
MALDLQSLLDALQTAYYTGATTVSYDGKTITYRSATEMQAAIVALKAQLGYLTPGMVVVRGDKGWD